MVDDLLPWTEKYRPKKLDEIVGQEEIVKSLKMFVERKNMPNMLFSGPPGIGKTTTALALANELYEGNIEGQFLELNASDERGINIVRGKIKDFARMVSMDERYPFKMIFLDEADALTPEAQNAMRRTMELYSRETRFILSCNYSSKIIEPIQSRCAVFRFSSLKDSEVKAMLRRIADSEQLDINDEAIDAIFYVSEGDMRKAINILQGASLYSGKITAETVHKVSSRARPAEIKEMVELAINSNFLEARKRLNKLIIDYGLSGQDILLQVYREIPNLNISERRKIKLVDILGEYDFRLVEGANERIQIESFLARLGVLGGGE